MPPINVSGLIPTRIATTITQEAVQQSIVLRLANRVPMPAGVSVVPIPKTFPKAAWTTAVGGRKAFTDFSFGTEQMQAEEVAAVISIPDSYLDDVDINLWNYARPRLAEAIGEALDLAVIWGQDAPGSFPAGGLAAIAVAAAAGVDPIDTINNAMSVVEATGLPVTGSGADLAVRGLLRGVRDENGSLLLGPGDVASGGLNSLYGAPISFSPFPVSGAFNFITGDWNTVILGVRSDIRYAISSEAVIADADGKVVISGFQDNQTIMKVWARYGCVVVVPPTRANPDPTPFSTAQLAARVPASPGDSAARAGGAAKKAA